MSGLQTNSKSVLVLSAGIITALLIYASYNATLAYRTFSSLKHEEHGDKLMEERKYIEAERELQLAVGVNPGYAGAHYHLGVALYQNGKIDASIKEFRETVEIAPYFSSAYYYLGKALNDLGHRNEARDAWHRVLALPERPWARAAQEQLDKYPEVR